VRGVERLEASERLAPRGERRCVEARGLLRELDQRGGDAVVLADDDRLGALLHGGHVAGDEGEESLLLAREVNEEGVAKRLHPVTDLVELVFELRLAAVHPRERVVDGDEEAAQLSVIMRELLDRVGSHGFEIHSYTCRRGSQNS